MYSTLGSWWPSQDLNPVIHLQVYDYTAQWHLNVQTRTAGHKEDSVPLTSSYSPLLTTAFLALGARWQRLEVARSTNMKVRMRVTELGTHSSKK